MSSQEDDLDAELQRIREGADSTPRNEAVPASAGQLWHMLLTAEPERRMQMLEAWRAQLDVAYRCFACDHDGRLAVLESRLTVHEMNRATSP